LGFNLLYLIKITNKKIGPFFKKFFLAHPVDESAEADANYAEY